MTVETQMSIQETISYFFENEIEEYLENGGNLKTDDSRQGWAEFVKTNFVESGRISQENFSSYSDYMFGQCESSYRFYKAKLNEAENYL